MMSSPPEPSRITINADRCHGQPCVRDLRIRVVDVLAVLAGGDSVEEVLAEYPDLTAEDIRACLAYPAE